MTDLAMFLAGGFLIFVAGIAVGAMWRDKEKTDGSR